VEVPALDVEVWIRLLQRADQQLSVILFPHRGCNIGSTTAPGRGGLGRVRNSPDLNAPSDAKALFVLRFVERGLGECHVLRRKVLDGRGQGDGIGLLLMAMAPGFNRLPRSPVLISLPFPLLQRPSRIRWGFELLVKRQVPCRPHRVRRCCTCRLAVALEESPALG
jgi:hypothetical protein